MRYTFDTLMRLAEEEAGGVDVPTRPAIVKELLHYDEGNTDVDDPGGVESNRSMPR